MNIEWMKEMIECISPSSHEEMVQKRIYQHYKDDFEQFHVEGRGALTAVLNETADFRIMLAAHADEISLTVTGYNENGTLQVDLNGGIRTKLYVGSRVQILTPSGEVIKAVMGTTSALQKKEKVEAKDLFVDLGCDTKQEAMELVPKGSHVVHDSDFTALQKGKYAARAFDDKIGVYIIFEAAKRAKELGSTNGIYVTATTQEETIGGGAYFSASRIKPNVCVAVDVTYAADYGDPAFTGDVALGKGGSITRGAVPNARLNDLLEECAEELALPIQTEISTERTYTDADTMYKTMEGTEQVLFSIPLRYMHSSVEVLDERDVDSMIEILAHFLVKLNAEYDLRPYTLE